MALRGDGRLQLRPGHGHRQPRDGDAEDRPGSPCARRPAPSARRSSSRHASVASAVRAAPYPRAEMEERLVRFRPRAVLVVLGVILAARSCCRCVRVTRDVLIWISIAVFLALALNPAVDWLQAPASSAAGAAVGDRLRRRDPRRSRHRRRRSSRRSSRGERLHRRGPRVRRRPDRRAGAGSASSSASTRSSRRSARRSRRAARQACSASRTPRSR